MLQLSRLVVLTHNHFVVEKVNKVLFEVALKWGLTVCNHTDFLDNLKETDKRILANLAKVLCVNFN